MPLMLERIDRDSPDFAADTGAKVTLATSNHIGAVMVAIAEYNGKNLIPEGTAVSEFALTVAKDRHTLKLVFVFTASTMGRGELREVAGRDSQFLRDAAGDEPFQALTIIGR